MTDNIFITFFWFYYFRYLQHPTEKIMQILIKNYTAKRGVISHRPTGQRDEL